MQESQQNIGSCDTIIECSDGQVHCHSLTLAAASNFWKNLLGISIYNDSFRIIIPNVEKKEFEMILNFLYKGRLLLSDNMEMFLKIFKQILPDIETNIKRDDNDQPQNKDTKIDQEVCKFCFVYFSSKAACEKHKKRYHYNEDAYFVCNVCAGKFKTEIALNDHVKHKHSEEPQQVFSCETCAKSFAYESTLRRHISSKGHQYPTTTTSKEIKEGYEACPICGKIVGRMEYHMKKYHQNDSQVYKCSKCEKKFDRKDTMFKHEKHVHGLYSIHFSGAAQSLQVNSEEWKCKMCHKSFDTVKKMEDHLALRNCSGVGFWEHICEYCKKSYKEKTSLRQHIQIKHLDKEKMFKCDKCGRTYQARTSLNRHIKTCTKKM